MSVTDAAIVARWTVRLKIRERLLAYARRQVAYWTVQRAKARTLDRRNHATEMLINRREKVKRREAQVSNARRVIARHSRPRVVRGIDVSNNNGTVNFALVKGAGYEFVYLKATEGTSFKDQFFLGNVKRATAVGLKVGAYHFLRPGNADAQAAVFVGRVGAAGLGKGDLLPVVDVEAQGVTSVDVSLFIAGVERRLGVKPLIYTFPSFMAWHSTYGCPLWIANFGVAAPTVPKPWTEYAIWQHSSDASVPGVKGKCDVNVCPDLSKVIA